MAQPDLCSLCCLLFENDFRAKSAEHSLLNRKPRKRELLKDHLCSLFGLRVQLGTQLIIRFNPRNPRLKFRSADIAGRWYLFSANGAIFIRAWGNAPGLRQKNSISAESAIHLHTWRASIKPNASPDSRFQRWLRGNFFLGRRPRLA